MSSSYSCNSQDKAGIDMSECNDCYYNPQCKKCETCLRHCKCKNGR